MAIFMKSASDAGKDINRIWILAHSDVKQGLMLMPQAHIRLCTWRLPGMLSLDEA